MSTSTQQMFEVNNRIAAIKSQILANSIPASAFNGRPMTAGEQLRAAIVEAKPKWWLRLGTRMRLK